MKGSHNEKALQRIEALLGTDANLYVVFISGEDGRPVPGKPPKLIGGTEASRAHAMAEWKKAEAARLRRLARKAGA